MRRPHLMRRLVDGSAEDSGRTISRRTTTLMIPAIAGANAIGGAVVLFLALYVVPRPKIHDATAAQIANFTAFGVFGVVAVLVGIFWGYKSTEPTRAWLIEDRDPDEDEQRRALRTPRRQLVVSATLWSLAVVVFTALNAVFSVGLAIVVGIIVALGGATTSAIAYLLAERLYRPVIARALSKSPPQRPVTPGIISRSLAAWALGTGVPVFGLALVAIASLAGREVSDTQLAVTILGLGGISLVVGLFATWQAAHSVADPVISVREALNAGGERGLRAGGAGVRRQRAGPAPGRLQPHDRRAARARGDARPVRPPGGHRRGQGGHGAGHRHGRGDGRGGRCCSPT